MSKKITQLNAGFRPRNGDLWEVVQQVASTSTSVKVAAEQIIPPGDLSPTTADAMDDEFFDSATLPGGGSALWAWNNQGGATATISGGLLTITAPAVTGNNMRALEQTAPATPWTVTTKVNVQARPGQNYSTVGMFFRDIVTGRCYAWGPIHDSNDNLTLFKFSSNTAVSSVAVGDLAPWSKSCYLQVSDDGTNVSFRHSLDGVNFAESFTEPRATYLTSGISRIGLFACSNSSTIPCVGSFPFFRRV